MGCIATPKHNILSNHISFKGNNEFKISVDDNDCGHDHISVVNN